MSDLQKRKLSSEETGGQIIGAILKCNLRYICVLIMFILIFSGISYLISPEKPLDILWLFVLNIVAFWAIKTCFNLLEVFSLRKKDSAITWTYITILFILLVWLIFFLWIFNDEINVKDSAIIGAIGLILSWVFQDKIRGAATYINLRLHNLLKIGDWIQVPSEKVDGCVVKITPTTVIVSNWDTTISVFPINVLSSNEFINLQNMMEGKTYGRRMAKTFILDTGWFHPLTPSEIDHLKRTTNVSEYLQDDDLQPNVSNAKLFRLYLYHWLSRHPHVSQQPRLLVRWLEQADNGMPLDVYAFITDSSLMPFEWQQSQIIEHIIFSLEAFGLRLYQSPSSYDVSNSNIYLAPNPATYRN